MDTFKILTFLLTCVLIAVVTDGRAVENKTFRQKNKTTWKVYLDENANRMVLTTERNGRINDCYISGDDYVIAIALRAISSSRIIKLSRKMMSSLTQYCTYAKWSKTLGSSGEEMYQELGMVSGMLIYPGTKWCGAGNVSEGYDDLGPEVEADRCCRDHDHCDDSIEGYGSKYGLDNNSPFTKSHCRCDKIFYNCLQEANTQSSNRVGKIFFNYIRMECFKLEHPIRSCSRYKGIEEIEKWIGNYIKIHIVPKRYIRPRCVEYDLDEEQKPIWQFFDAKEYKPIDEERKLKSNKLDVFEYMLLPSSQICNGTSDAENKSRVSSYLMNLTLRDILSNASKHPVNQGETLYQRTKRKQLEDKHFQNVWSVQNPC